MKISEKERRDKIKSKLPNQNVYDIGKNQLVNGKPFIKIIKGANSLEENRCNNLCTR